MNGRPDEQDPVRAERMRDQELSSRVVPAIEEGYRSGRESVAVAKDLERRFGLDPHKAYDWCEIIFEQLERSRRRIAGAFLAAMWLGGILLLIAAIGFLTGSAPLLPPEPETAALAAAGVLLVAAGSIGGLKARRLARTPRYYDE